MFTLPTPLHPLIVHFPIVLVLLGAAVAVAAVVIRRWNLPWIAAVLLSLGTIGAWVAAETGEDAEDQAGALSTAADTLLEEHEEAAERTEAASAAAAFLAVVAATLGAFAARRNEGVPAAGPGWLAHPMLPPGLRAVTAVAALTACFFVYQTGHAGGKLVYEHGVGVKQGPASLALPAAGAGRGR